MPSHLISNSLSTAAGKPSDVVLHSSASAADIPAEVVSLSAAAPSSPSSPSSSASRLSEMWSYLWIPFLISLSKEFGPAKAQPESILLPSQLNRDSPPRCPASDPKLNYRPVIGIVSHPGDGASGRLSNASSASYIAASYVKFVESAGARVIPIIYNEPPEIIFQKLNLVNGVLFTGGWAKTGPYYEIVERIFKKVLERNDAGEYFPLYAICLGFEILTMIISKDNKILESFSASDMASTLQFTQNVNIEGTVFQRFPPDLLRKLSTDCLIMQNHKYGISPERFQENRDLCQFFKILTTSADEDNKVYVSTVHAHNYPVTAFQWHPEKNAFEWGLKQIPHSEDAIHVTQHVANFLVSEARKSLNRPPLQKVLDNLIYNYSPTYCGKAGKGYDEVYIFTRSSL
ncbi:Gamma-glutamyl hydrolase [Morus notabilis]|uniref:folate gamma-glutamyl hydrolase n=1 Tax=Morus notabilis TaxID=981085 RepID=W9SIZ0_9ROSA|nr:gamma-glutamyl hydrolase 2 isoform X2 [Morus notabilis]EXC10782.1 Gamma-glutamyl hydrolase [Morus notabilis]